MFVGERAVARGGGDAVPAISDGTGGKAQEEFGSTLDSGVDLDAAFTPEALLMKAYQTDAENEATETETVTPG